MLLMVCCDTPGTPPVKCAVMSAAAMVRGLRRSVGVTEGKSPAAAAAAAGSVLIKPEIGRVKPAPFSKEECSDVVDWRPSRD